MENQYPKITIVTQCFNRAQYIAETIESVLNQGYPNLEYIVIDDNSTDGSWEIIQKYKDRLTFCGQLPGDRKTPVPAINYGFSKSTGEIMTWLNAKNVLMPKSLFTIAEVFNTFQDVEWVAGIGLTIDGDGKVIHVVPYRKDYWGYLGNESGNIQQESAFFRRSLWERSGGSFDEAYPNAFDVGLWCGRFFPHNGKLVFLNTIVGAYRKSSAAMSTARRAEFMQYAKAARSVMRASAPKNHLLLAFIYRVLGKLHPLLRNIPDPLWSKLPFLKIFSQDAIKFSTLKDDRGTLIRYKRNPFRTIFPA